MRRSSIALLLGLIGCGGESGGSSVVESSPDPRHNVLIIDDGFDPGSPALAGRVAAQYTVDCLGRDPAEFVPMPAGESRRATVLRVLQSRDSHCHLRWGIDPKPDPLADISTYRPAWNKLVENNAPAESVFTAAQIAAIGRGRALSRGRYHGTATASVIAHANPEVRFVLVERRIGTDPDDSGAFTCLTQRELDDVVALFADAEVQRAYVERPPSALDEELAEVEARHRVGLTNESWGYVSRPALEARLVRQGCLRVDLRPYFTLLGQLELERERAHPRPDTLLVKSAGNDGTLLSGPEDVPTCAGAAAERLMVGAYSLDGRRASFSNTGPCVDVFTPGVQVITHLPGGWLMPLDGTSFSAPLLVRLVSLGQGPFSPATARAEVLAGRDAQLRIPVDRFPRELFYDPNNTHWAAR